MPVTFTHRAQHAVVSFCDELPWTAVLLRLNGSLLDSMVDRILETAPEPVAAGALCRPPGVLDRLAPELGRGRRPRSIEGVVHALGVRAARAVAAADRAVDAHTSLATDS